MFYLHARTAISRTSLLDSFVNILKNNSLIQRKMSSVTTEGDVRKQLQDQFLDAASGGKLEEVNHLIKGAVDVNGKNERGWNGLMLAARNGHTQIISSLLEKGCNTEELNSTGQTAFDIATFWNHKEAAATLRNQIKEEKIDQNCRNFFSLNLLNRLAEKRKDKTWLLDTMKLSSSKYILFSNLKPYVTDVPRSVDMKTKWKYLLARFTFSDIEFHLETKPSIVLLGQDRETNSASLTPDSAGAFKPSTYFAIDVTDVPEDRFTNTETGVSLLPVPMPGAMQLEPSEGGIFSEARSLLAWHDRYKFCPTCGTLTHPDEGGYKRSCDYPKCRSHQGVHNTCYPRVDPSMIMLVVSPDNQKCLLGRGRHFPHKMYSCLAGYMEPGESLEDTCRREVEEESGIQVGKVEYHSSQPWPFPAVLMLGCIAYAKTTQIKVDKDELEDARWFTRPEVVKLLTNQHSEGLFVPPGQAIAHQLIKSWVRMTANL